MQSEAQRREVVEEFARRRRRELVALVPLAISLGSIFFLLKEPEVEIPGIPRLHLFVALGVVAAAGIVHHLVNWRCPACNLALLTGVAIGHCPRCGALFKASERGGGVDRREQMDRAVEADLGDFRLGQARWKMMAVVVIVFGALLAVFAPFPDTMGRDGLLVRKFGEAGAVRATVAIGLVLVAAGLLWIAVLVRRLPTAARRREAETRAFLEEREREREGEDGRFS